MNKTTLTTMLCVGLLAATVFASTAVAKPGDDQPAPEDRRQAGKAGNHTADHQNRSADRMDRHERMRAAHDAWQDCKREARNATGNESHVQRCGDEKSFFLNATKARREAHVLHGAIEALERRLGRLEAREIALEQQLASGNLSANETAEVEAKIAKIDSHQDRMAERLEELRERLEARQARWQAARDAVAEHDDEDDQDDDEEESSSSSSSSAAA